MTKSHEIPLDLPTFEALDGALCYHRTAALLSPLAPEPMTAFQADLVSVANRLGFQPAEPGAFRIQVQPGGRNALCWDAATTTAKGVADGCDASI